MKGRVFSYSDVNKKKHEGGGDQTLGAWSRGLCGGCQNRRGCSLILLRAITRIIGREYDISEFQNRIKNDHG